MCPTYQVTGEEDASTRGRARLLYDMSRGHLAGGRRSRALARALDLCLGCKACKTDCPAGVDMAAFRVAHLWPAAMVVADSNSSPGAGRRRRGDAGGGMVGQGSGGVGETVGAPAGPSSLPGLGRRFGSTRSRGLASAPESSRGGRT
ncbi:MAG: 4Fe-4S dicluster domain-containing protein, partial [Anaerolineae bacterium]